MPRPSKRKRKHDQLVFSKIRRNIIATVLLLTVLAAITAAVILVPLLFYTPPQIAFSARHYVYSNADDQLMFDGESVDHLRQQFGKLKNYRAFDNTPDSEIKDTEQPKYAVPENFKKSDILVVYLNAHVVVSEQSDVRESVRLLNPDQRPDPNKDSQELDQQFLFDNSQSLANILENIAAENALLKIVLLDAGDFGWSPLTPNRQFNRFADKLDEYFESIKDDESFKDFWLITSHGSFESSLVLHSDQTTVFAESVSLAMDNYYQESADDKFRKREFSVASFYTHILKNARQLTRANDGGFLQTPLLFRPGLGVVRQSGNAESKEDSQVVFKFEQLNDDGKKRFSQRDHSDSKYLADLKSKLDFPEIESIADRSELAAKFSAQPSQTVKQLDDFLYKNVRMEKSKSKLLAAMKLDGVDNSNYSSDFAEKLEFAIENVRKHKTNADLLQAKKDYVEQLRGELFYLTYFSRLADLAIANGLLPSQIHGDGGFETYVTMSLKPSTRTLNDREIVENKLTDSMTFVADPKKYKQEKTDLWKKHFKELTSLNPQSLYVAEQKLFLTALIPAEMFPPDPAGEGEKKENETANQPTANTADTPSSVASDRFPSSPRVNQKRAGYRVRFLNRILNEYGGGNVSAMSLAYRGSNETIDGDWSIDRWPLSIDVKQPATADVNSKFDLGIRLATLLGRPSKDFAGRVPGIVWLARDPGVTLTLNKQNEKLKVNLDEFRSGVIQTAISTEDIEKVAIELRVKQTDEAAMLSKFVKKPWIRWSDSNAVDGFKTLDPNKQILTITTRDNQDQIDQNDLVIDWAALVTNGRELTAADLANKPVIVEVIPRFDRDDDGDLDAAKPFEIEVHFPAPTTLQVNVNNQHFTAGVNPISEQQMVLNRWQDLDLPDRRADVQTITTLTNVKSQFSFSLSNQSGRDRLFRCVLYRFIGPQDKDFDRHKGSFSGKPEDWYPGNMSEFIREKVRQRIAADPGVNLDKYFEVVGQHETAAAVVATSQPQTGDDQELIFKPPAPKPPADGDTPAPVAPVEKAKTISHGLLLLVWELDDAKQPITSAPGWYQFLQFKKKSVRDYFEANDFQSNDKWVDSAGAFRPPINLLKSFAIGENDLISRKSGPEQKDKLIDPIVLQYANWTPGNETILSSELDNLFKNNDGDALSFGAINRNDDSVVFLDVMGVPRLYWYNIAKDGEPTDIDADARHFGLQLAESQEVAWKVAYRNGLLDTSGVSAGLRAAVFYRNANVSWVAPDHPAGPRVFLNNKAEVESGMKKPHPAFQVRLFLDQGEESVDGDSIYRVKWKDADQPDLLYHDYSRVFHYDFLDDGKLGFWCDVDDHRVMLDPKTNGSSVFVLERVFPDPFPKDDAPKPVTFLVNQGPPNASPISFEVDPNAINMKPDGKLEEELGDDAAIEFKIGNDQGTVFETAHLSIAERGNDKPIFEPKAPYKYQAFRNQFAVGKTLSMDEFLAQCQPVKDFIAKFRQTDLTGKPKAETTLDISFRLTDFFGNPTEPFMRSVKLVLTPMVVEPVKLPPPNPTNVTIFFHYKQELDDAGKPKIPEGEPLAAQNGIKILAMSIGGSKVNIQNWKNREGQTVKIDGKEYQVEKYLNNVITNAKGSPCVVIYGLPPRKYTITIDVNADFAGRVDEKSKGNKFSFEVVFDEKKKAEEDPQTGRRIPFEQEEKMFLNKKK